ncbi:hypothetical protein E2C01_062316 [Portunus trituberculatus]|uniref:Reverse transcriptase domain-containing protein n=1 Tax=Portunus trituberculatus TaxID=210409 RepID=A0A5B7H647_PORTR|nr:hypothetical protein [Portunus trituberculatus]
MEALFARLYDEGFVVNLDKCEFANTCVQNLGYVVSHSYLTQHEAKEKTIRLFRPPPSDLSPNTF